MKTREREGVRRLYTEPDMKFTAHNRTIYLLVSLNHVLDKFRDWEGIKKIYYRIPREKIIKFRYSLDY